MSVPPYPELCRTLEDSPCPRLLARLCDPIRLEYDSKENKGLIHTESSSHLILSFPSSAFSLTTKPLMKANRLSGSQTHFLEANSEFWRLSSKFVGGASVFCEALNDFETVDMLVDGEKVFVRLTGDLKLCIAGQTMNRSCSVRTDTRE